jgi:hypothetical protein
VFFCTLNDGGWKDEIISNSTILSHLFKKKCVQMRQSTRNSKNKNVGKIREYLGKNRFFFFRFFP